MRISDWSSDVCSSDLLAPAPAHDILGLGDMVLKRLEQTGGVGGIQPDELLDEMAEQQAALAADRMNAHHRMLGFIDGRGKDVAMLRNALARAVAIGRRLEDRRIVIEVRMQIGRAHV